MRKAVFIVLCALLCTGCVKELNYYVISATADPAEGGTVTGGGTYLAGATATLSVIPAEGYTFIGWSDGNKDNPRNVTVNADANYIANCSRGDDPTGPSYMIIHFGVNRFSELFEPGYCVVDMGVINTRGLIGFMIYKQESPSPYDMYTLGMAVSATPGRYTAYQQTATEYAGTDSAYTCPAGSNDSNNIYNIEMCWNQPIRIGDVVYGDWMFKSATYKLTSIDLNSLTFSFTLDAVMFDFYSWAFNSVMNWEDADTEPLQVHAANQKFVASN